MYMMEREDTMYMERERGVHASCGMTKVLSAFLLTIINTIIGRTNEVGSCSCYETPSHYPTHLFTLFIVAPTIGGTNEVGRHGSYQTSLGSNLANSSARPRTCVFTTSWGCTGLENRRFKKNNLGITFGSLDYAVRFKR